MSFLFFPWDHNGVPVYGIGWTLNYEMFFYVIFAGTLLFGRRTSAVVITAGFAALVGLGQTGSLPLPWSYWANPIILEFVMGVWLAIGYVEGLRLPRPLCIALIVAGVGLFALGYLHGYNIGLQVGHSLIPRAVGWGVPALLIVAGSILPSQPKEPGPIARHLANIGDASYAIYLFQVIAVMGLWRLPHPMAGAFKLFLANCYDEGVLLRHGMEARKGGDAGRCCGGSVHDSPAAGGGSRNGLLGDWGDWRKGLTPRHRSRNIRLSELLRCSKPAMGHNPPLALQNRWNAPLRERRYAVGRQK
jgi:hypothetical protein